MKTPPNGDAPSRSLLRAIPALLTLLGSLLATTSVQAKPAEPTALTPECPPATSTFEARAARIQKALRDQTAQADGQTETQPDQQQAWWGNWHNWHNGGWRNGGWHNWNNWHNWHNW